MSGHRHIRGRRSGFTLVELIVVIVVISILGAIGAARFMDRRGFDAASFAEQTRAMLRFSQKLAVAQNRPVYAQLNGSTIGLCFATTVPCPVASRVPAIGANGGATACGTGWYCEAAPGTIAYALVPVSATVVCFNALGQPGVVVSGACSAAAFPGVTVNITGDGAATPVTIAAETGYVY